MLKQTKKSDRVSKKYESEIAIEIKTASKSAKKIEPTVNNAEKSLKRFEKKVSMLSKEMLNSRQEKDDCQQSVQETRIKLIELES